MGTAKPDSRLELPKYDAAASDDSSESSDSGMSFISSKEATITMVTEEYDEDVEQSDGMQDGRIFHPLLNRNVFVIAKDSDSALIGLREKQTIFLSGIFQLQIVKGGIIYNNTHYNASKDHFTMWHPICNSIPVIQSSFYAGWDETSHLEFRHQDYLAHDLQDFHCVIRVRNASVDGLLQACDLYADVRHLWGPSTGFTQDFLSNNCKYSILREGIDPFIPLDISKEWSASIDQLTLAHHSSMHDMRVMVIGGKNSGKSTFLRLLLENFITSGSSQRNAEDLWYLDLDPGQPEYSSPDCVSLNRILCGTKVRGRHLGQPYCESLKQCYVGANSPQDVPTAYMEHIDELFQFVEEESYVGTSFVNLPGWIKGFGIEILNHVIEKYKPTHIILLQTSTSKKHFEELRIPSQFTSYTGLDYTPEVSKLTANFIKAENSRFNATQIRTFKTLAYFHTLRKDKSNLQYDFTPLVKDAPLQISFGSSGIRGIFFLEEFLDLNASDLKTTLEGTAVGLYTCAEDIKDSNENKNALPILKMKPRALEFFGLALVHSIDMDNKFFNLYLPQFLHEKLSHDSKISWIIFRGKTETPLCELFPPGHLFSAKSASFISTERRKKYEHVWKVRKNIMRRGHNMP